MGSRLFFLEENCSKLRGNGNTGPRMNQSNRIVYFQWVNRLVNEIAPKGKTNCLLYDQIPWSFRRQSRKEFAPGGEARGPVIAARKHTAD